MSHLDRWWLHPPTNLTIANDKVHVWRASLDLAAVHIRELECTLASDERERAERFRFHKDRVRFIVAHGLLRAILGRYVGVEPSQLRFCYSSHGKPALAWEFEGGVIRFNLSHSHKLALYAVTCGREVGIDLEYIRADLAGEQIVRQFFSPREVADLQALPADMQTAAFFNCWTRKEAYIKARGEGLSLPLDQFAVSLAPGEPAVLLSTAGDSSEAARWSLQALYPGTGYVAALAVEGHSWRLESWQWLGHL
ncbi:MAG: 4'-phosphopantetheinyl transferase superfamily protein [Chloroflexota bacterium]|nr:4'-phosphopantetheinyl transferase superfamily protein [Chloroflexota bacterium]